METHIPTPLHLDADQFSQFFGDILQEICNTRRTNDKPMTTFEVWREFKSLFYYVHYVLWVSLVQSAEMLYQTIQSHQTFLSIVLDSSWKHFYFVDIDNY